MSRAARQSATPQEQGDQAIALAGELTDRIARERRTVRALKDHLISAAEPAHDAVPEQDAPRVHAPSRRAPVLVDQDTWHPLGECLRCRRYLSEDGVVVLELAGEVDMSGALRLRTLVSDLLDETVEQLSLDLAQVSFMDSNGLSALLWIRRRAMATETAFLVCAVHPRLLRLLHVTGLNAILLPSRT